MNYLQRIKIIDELIKEYFIEDMIYNDINVKLKTPINILGDIEKFSEIVKKSNNIKSKFCIYTYYTNCYSSDLC